MRLLIIAVGERVPDWVAKGCKQYVERFRKPWSLTLKEVQSERRSTNADLSKLVRREGPRLLAAVPRGWRIVAFDQEGCQHSTETLTKYFGQWTDDSENIAFLIGGPDGLSKEVLNRANNIWSLSQLTLAHSMARLVILEQFYRAFSILRGMPYHRGASNFKKEVDT